MTIVLSWALLKGICLASMVVAFLAFFRSKGSIEGGYHGTAWFIAKLSVVVFLSSLLVLFIRALVI